MADDSGQADTQPTDWAKARDLIRDWLLDGRDMAESDWTIDQLLEQLADLDLRR